MCAVWILGSKPHSWACCHSTMTLLLDLTSCLHGGSNTSLIFHSLGGPEAHTQSRHLSWEMLTLQAPPYFQWCAHTLGLFPPFLDLPHCSKPLLFDDTSEWFMSLRMIYYGASKTFSGAFLIKYFLKSKSLLKVLLYSFSKSLILLFITGRQRICNKVKI